MILAMQMEPEKYPKRPAFFSHRFVRLMAKVCLANELGPEACWFLTLIAHTEDAKSYRDAVTYWNEHLYPLVGLGSVSSLKRLRSKIVEAGWLHYEPGRKRCAPRYWVVIPERFDDMDDNATGQDDGVIADEDDEDSGPPVTHKADRKRTQSGPESGRNVDQKADGKRTTFIPIPDPSPNPVPNTNAGIGVPPPPESDEPTADSAVKAEKKPRERDLLWDAIVEVTGAVDGGAIGRAKKLMIEKFNPPITPDEVRRFVAEMPLRLPWAKGNLTPSFLRSNIHLVRQPLPSDSEKSNGHGNRVGPSNRIRPAEGKYDGIGTLYDLHAEAGGEGQPPPAA